VFTAPSCPLLATNAHQPDDHALETAPKVHNSYNVITILDRRTRLIRKARLRWFPIRKARILARHRMVHSGSSLADLLKQCFTVFTSCGRFKVSHPIISSYIQVIQSHAIAVSHSPASTHHQPQTIKPSPYPSPYPQD
jgi:hypothetical protein